MPNLSKNNDPRFWVRWHRAGAVERKTERFDDATRRKLIADHVVDIPQCGLYAKTPQGLAALMQQLLLDGYNIADNGESAHYRAPGTYYASLREDVAQFVGKCGSCKSYISRLGIETHKHKCEVCGAHTFIEYPDGAITRFRFLNDPEAGDYEPSIKMKVKEFDDESGCLILYVTPENGNDFNDWSVKNALKVLKRNRPKFTFVTRGGFGFIAIRYAAYSMYVEQDAVISMSEITNQHRNFQCFKLYQGREYSEYDRLPVVESYTVRDASKWKLLEPSPGLHEKIISAAGMVSRCDYYYQDGRCEFYDIHLLRMRLFVEHFTALNLQDWDTMIARADKSGPGMIRAIGHFCHQQPRIVNEPNIFNLLIGASKLSSGERITAGEVEAMADAVKDPSIVRDFLAITEPRVVSEFV